jgi:hypothetical protein
VPASRSVVNCRFHKFAGSTRRYTRPALLFGRGKSEPELFLQGSPEDAANGMALSAGHPRHLVDRCPLGLSRLGIERRTVAGRSVCRQCGADRSGIQAGVTSLACIAEPLNGLGVRTARGHVEAVGMLQRRSGRAASSTADDVITRGQKSDDLCGDLRTRPHHPPISLNRNGRHEGVAPRSLLPYV